MDKIRMEKSDKTTNLSKTDWMIHIFIAFFSINILLFEFIIVNI
jgi:hypothetical protein